MYKKIINKNIFLIFWANGLSVLEGCQKCGYKSIDRIADDTVKGKTGIMEQEFGVTLDDLYAEDCLERVYGQHRFSNNINVLLALTDMRKGEYTDAVGIRPTEYGKYQRMERRPYAKTIKKTAELFEISTIELLFGRARVEFDLDRGE